jgi:hypothetical protein
VQPVAQAAAPIVQPVAQAAAPIVQAAAPVLAAVEPVLESAAPVLESAQPVVDAAAPLLEATSPLLGSTEPLLEATGPLLGSTGPLLNSTGPLRDSTGSLLSSAPAPEMRPSDAAPASAPSTPADTPTAAESSAPPAAPVAWTTQSDLSVSGSVGATSAPSMRDRRPVFRADRDVTSTFDYATGTEYSAASSAVSTGGHQARPAKAVSPDTPAPNVPPGPIGLGSWLRSPRHSRRAQLSCLLRHSPQRSFW